jgi:hypothetical protein
VRLRAGLYYLLIDSTWWQVLEVTFDRANEVSLACLPDDIHLGFLGIRSRDAQLAVARIARSEREGSLVVSEIVALACGGDMFISLHVTGRGKDDRWLNPTVAESDADHLREFSHANEAVALLLRVLDVAADEY